MMCVTLPCDLDHVDHAGVEGSAQKCGNDSDRDSSSC